MAAPKTTSTKIELNAVIVSVEAGMPRVLVDPYAALPSGSFETGHRTLEQGLRAWAGMKLGYVEQLYTFADSDRTARDNQRIVSIGYLALMRAAAAPTGAVWSSWYAHFPWEDHRAGQPSMLEKGILPALTKWKNAAGHAAEKRDRAARIAIAFPDDMKLWNEELVLQRYELLWESGLVAEAQKTIPLNKLTSPQKLTLGQPMAHDHRRILATAMARLRAKIKYRPVVFELLPDAFTLLHLQNTVEALAGLKLHKQNFRRLVESQGLVEETGAMIHGASGRPAKLFTFRRDVLQERAVGGTKLPRSG